MNLAYGYKRINKVLDSCTNRFRYITAIKYLDLMIKKYYNDNSGIDVFYKIKKDKVFNEFS